MKARVRTTVVFSLAGLAVAGCGAEDHEQTREEGPLSRSEYQAEILDVVRDSSAPTSLYTDLVVRSRRRDECERMMVRFRDEVNDLVERIAALAPPPEVANIHDDFVAAARRSVDRVRAITRQVAAGAVGCGEQLNGLIYGMPSSDRAQRLISQLERHRYFVFGD